MDGVVAGRVRVAVGEGVWEIYSTVVLPQYEGRGIAAALVRRVLDDADAAHVTVIPSCWYVDGLMRRDAPRYDHLRGQVARTREDDSCLIAPVVVGTTTDSQD